jgi:hypothetical protein
MSIIPKNFTIQENTIDVEYNDCHWCYKGGIVPLLKNNDKIIYKYDDAIETIVLDYDDGMEKFSICLNKKLNLPPLLKSIDISEKIKSFDALSVEITEKIKEIDCKKDEEEKIIDNHQKIIDNHQKIIDEQKKIIDEQKKIINEHHHNICTLNTQSTELGKQIDCYSILLKHKCGIQLNLNDRFGLLLKEFITFEHFMANSTASDINELINIRRNQFEKLIIDKKFNINTKNKEGKTLLEITLVDYDFFPIFLLQNDIDILPSIKNDIKIHKYCSNIGQAYFDNAKRNGHIDFLVTHRNDIRGIYLKELVDQYIKTIPSLENGAKTQ